MMLELKEKMKDKYSKENHNIKPLLVLKEDSKSIVNNNFLDPMQNLLQQAQQQQEPKPSFLDLGDYRDILDGKPDANNDEFFDIGDMNARPSEDGNQQSRFVPNTVSMGQVNGIAHNERCHQNNKKPVNQTILNFQKEEV